MNGTPNGNITLEIEDQKITVVTCYAPQTGCTEDAEDELWESLQDYIRTIPPHEIMFIGGDLNEHVGKKSDQFRRVHGGNGYGNQNDDGRNPNIGICRK